MHLVLNLVDVWSVRCYRQLAMRRSKRPQFVTASVFNQ
jgi:hypothetical protein